MSDAFARFLYKMDKFKNLTFLYLNFYWLALLVAYLQSVKISLGLGRSLNGPKLV